MRTVNKYPEPIQGAFLKRDSDEWNRAWEELAKSPFNKGLKNPTIAHNQGEAWQYMGTYCNTDGEYIHNFRHRCHPVLNSRLYINIPVGDMSEDQYHKGGNYV